MVSSDTNLNIPKLEIDSSNFFTVPNIDVQELLKIQEGKQTTEKEEGIYSSCILVRTNINLLMIYRRFLAYKF